MKHLCVYCGSRLGHDPEFVEGADALACALVAREITLVYGGASVGLMGRLADRVLALGGRVIGVIPESLLQRESAHAHLTELHVTHSMHERKTRMAGLADGFIAMPGGVGTLEEIFEIWTWAQLNFHHKPCGLLNVAGYYDRLIAFLDSACGHGFISQGHRDLLLLARTADDLLDLFQAYSNAPRPRRYRP